MERTSNVLPTPSKPKLQPRKERGHHQRTSATDRVSKASSERKGKETPETKEVRAEQATDVRVKSTVVDIDSVRREDQSVGLLEASGQEDGVKRKSLGVFEWLLMVFVLTLVLLFLPLSIWFCVKVVREHERAVIFRLGHLLRGKPKGPGLFFYLPILDVCHIVDIRLKMLKVPFHTVVTKDLVRPELSAVCYYQIENVALCCAALSNLTSTLETVVQAVVRDVLAQHTFSHILVQRKKMGQQIQIAADAVACRWGIKVERADIGELSFPVELQQKLDAESEAKRQQQIRTKAAAGERDTWEGFRASLRLLHPALVLPLPPDLLNVSSDLSPLPPSPPPLDTEGDNSEPGTDSPMM